METSELVLMSSVLMRPGNRLFVFIKVDQMATKPSGRSVNTFKQERKALGGNVPFGWFMLEEVGRLTYVSSLCITVHA